MVAFCPKRETMNTLETPSQIDHHCRALSDDELDAVAAGGIGDCTCSGNAGDLVLVKSTSDRIKAGAAFRDGSGVRCAPPELVDRKLGPSYLNGWTPVRACSRRAEPATCRLPQPGAAAVHNLGNAAACCGKTSDRIQRRDESRLRALQAGRGVTATSWTKSSFRHMTPWRAFVHRPRRFLARRAGRTAPLPPFAIGPAVPERQK